MWWKSVFWWISFLTKLILKISCVFFLPLLPKKILWRKSIEALILVYISAQIIIVTSKKYNIMYLIRITVKNIIKESFNLSTNICMQIFVFRLISHKMFVLFIKRTYFNFGFPHRIKNKIFFRETRQRQMMWCIARKISLLLRWYICFVFNYGCLWVLITLSLEMWLNFFLLQSTKEKWD